MKPYQKIPIIDCKQPVIPIPLDTFAVVSPHPYQQLGADYAGYSPYYLRQNVVNALIQAQTQLQQQYPHWRIQIFDAYRPVAVQQFMVDYTFKQAVQAAGLNLNSLTATQQHEIWEQVYQLWAVPSLDANTPPPHSTGGAVDITLVDDTGNSVNMGAEIDELSVRSHPNYYANSTTLIEQQYHSHRLRLFKIMRSAGFQRHPGEWWHFCLGDQMWAYLTNLENGTNSSIACYGRVE